MSVCPNINSTEWKALEAAVGKLEAFRDFMETNGDIRTPEEVLAKLQKRSLAQKIKLDTFVNDSLFGLDIQNQKQLEFHINTLQVVSQFLENIGIEQRFVSKFLSQDGSVVEGAVAAANFIEGTVDIINDLNKGRTEAWNKLPEEAAHWWYRLLKEDSSLKKALWESHQTALKNDELYAGEYGKLVKSSSDLTEESIGQLIAEAIKRIETKNDNASDYSFFKKFLEWINKIVDAFKNTTQDPFEVAAMKILSSDMSDLMTWNEYRKLNNIVNFADVLTEQSVAPVDYTLLTDIGEIKYNEIFDEVSNESYSVFYFNESPYFTRREELDNWVSKEYGNLLNVRQKNRIQEVKDNQIFFDRLLNKSFRKKSKFLPKTLRKYYTIVDSQNLKSLPEWNVNEQLQKITKKLSEQEKKQIIETNGYTNIAPTLKVLPLLLQKYKKNPIVLSESIKIDGAKKQELSILNGIKELIKIENPSLKTITAEEFVAEAHNWLETNYSLGFANERDYLSYRTDQTFTYLSDRNTNEDVVNLTDEQIERLPLSERQRLAAIVGLTKQNPDVYHNKVSLRFNDMSHLKRGHFNLPNGGSPSAWGNLTYFYTGDTEWKDAVLLHEIQNDNIEFLREFEDKTVDLETSLGRYLQELNTDLLRNINQIESGTKQIKKDDIVSTFRINSKRHIELNYMLSDLINNSVNQELTLAAEQFGGAGYRFNPLLERFKQNLNERIELFKARGNSIEQSEQRLDQAYAKKRKFTDFQKRGGIKSLLTKEELEQLKVIINVSNTQETDLRSRKQTFNTLSSVLTQTINARFQEIYGTDTPYISLQSPVKPRTRTQIRQGVSRYQILNDNVNFLLASSEQRMNKNLSIAVENSKKDYIGIRNATNEFNFNVNLSKITAEQFDNLLENYRYNQNLLEKLVDEQAQKDLQKASIDFSILSDEEIRKDIYDGVFEKYAYKNIELNAETIEEAIQEVKSFSDKTIQTGKQKSKFEDLKQKALAKKIELEKNYGKIQDEVKEILDIELNYFTPLIHHLIQKHINNYGKEFPMYFSGYNITKLTQGNDRTAMIYAGKDEVNIVDKSDFFINGKGYRRFNDGSIIKTDVIVDAKGKILGRQNQEQATQQEYEKAYQQATEQKAKEIKYKAAQEIGLIPFEKVISKDRFEVNDNVYKFAPELKRGKYSVHKKDDWKTERVINSTEFHAAYEKALNKTSLEEGIKKLNEYKKQSKQNLDRVINAIMNISRNKPIETGAIYNAMSQVSGIKLIWQDQIKGLNNNTGGYLVDLSDYNYNVPILFGLSAKPVSNVKQLDLFEQDLNIQQLDVPGSPANTSLIGQAIMQDEVKNTVEPTSDTHVEAMSMAKQMSEAMEIDYQIITPEEAMALTANAKNPWKAGDKAFYIGGIVYFVGNHLSMENAFHEFSHPFVRHIAATNPTLFNTLYNQIIATPEGQVILADMAEAEYDLDINSDLYKEEVIVRALTAAGLDKLDKLKTQSAFSKAINNILYAIKQALRKAFGKNVPVSQLNAGTTLNDLADMLIKGDKIILDKSKISQEDVVAYNKERTAFVNEMTKLGDRETQFLVNKFYDVTVNHINKLMSNRNYDALAELLTDADKRGDLNELKANLQAYQTTISNMAGKAVDEMEDVRKRSTALVNSLFRLDTVMSKILLHVRDIKEAGETRDNLHKAYYYDHLVKHWGKFIEEANEALDEKLPSNSELRHLITGIETNLRLIKNDINSMYAVGAKDALYNELLPMQKNLQEVYDAKINNLIKNNAPQTRIDKAHKEFYGVTQEQLKRLNQLKSNNRLSSIEKNELETLEKQSMTGAYISPEKIDRILKGNMGDANFFNSYLEGYLYNTDPVIGGLASYVKNKLSDVFVKAQANYNDFAKDMEKTLADAGFNPYRPGEFGERVGFLDTVAKREKDGTLTKRSVWSFLNPFKNYRYDYDVFKDTVEKAQVKYRETGKEEDRLAMLNAITERQLFLRNYFHQEYVPDFYEREKLFEKDDIGKEALYRRKEWGERLRALTEPANTPSQQLDISDEVDLMWREYRQMRSMYHVNGKPKTGFDAEVAKRIREYHEASLEFYESKPRRGAFQNALKSYEQQLIDEGVDDARRKVLIDQWIEKNTIKVPKESWYTWRNDLYKEQSEILSKLPKSEKAILDESLIMQQIFDLTGGFKDGEGQTKVTEMSPRSRAKVKELEEELEQLRKMTASRNGLTKAQNAEFNQLHADRATGNWSTDKANQLAELYELKNKYGLSKAEIRRLDTIRVLLAGESKREATDYYVDIMNTWMDQLNVSALGGIKQINRISADWLLDSQNIDVLLGQNADFDKWFKDNHLRKEKFNEQSKQMEPTWVRSTLWSVTVPTNEAHFETFDLTDEQGNVTRTIQGKPILKYFTRVVKAEYRNDKIVGETVDNKYQWLPKTKEQGAIDDTYINKEYFDLSTRDPKLFLALEKLKEHHLKNQSGISYKGRLYLDFPRYRKSTLEVLQSENILSTYAQRVKEFFKGAKDDAIDGMNDTELNENLVRMDMFDNEITDVPIHGLFDIDHGDVSTDITLTMMQYMLSGLRQKQLIEISPIARAVQEVVNANKLNKTDSNGFEFINKFNFFNRGIKTYEKQSGDSVRKKAIDNFITREFEGQRLTGPGADSAWLNNTANVLFKRASFGFFAFNIPSALKNSWGAKFQGLIEAAAGKHMTMTSFQQGNAWSYGTMAELSFGGQLYQKGAKSLNQQIVEVFDPSQDRFETNFGEGMSRTIAKDAANMSWLYNFRKWVELQATLQIFGGMMYHQKVEQTMADGTVKEIPYMEAWQTIDGKIQLKEGIDPTWGITYNENGEIQVGDKFKRFKNTTHTVMNNLQGAYAKFDQPEAQRYLAFRFLSYLRRYFTTMTLNRFGFSGRWSDPQPRFNPGSGDLQMGYYITFIQFAKETITTLGKNLMYMTPEEKQASLRVITEVGTLIAINLVMTLILGWDPDDDERYEKLRQKSGALPFPMVSEDSDRPFNGWGFLENHMLFLLMNVRAENEQFIPLPGYGLDDYTAMLDLKSIAFGPTVDSYQKILDDALDIMQGDESAYYKRDVGPYDFQKAESAKIWAHTASSLGLTGSALDPAKGIKNFQSIQARAK